MTNQWAVASGLVFDEIMTVVALLAAVGPARRELRIQPSEASQAEA